MFVWRWGQGRGHPCFGESEAVISNPVLFMDGSIGRLPPLTPFPRLSPHPLLTASATSTEHLVLRPEPPGSARRCQLRADGYGKTPEAPRRLRGARGALARVRRVPPCWNVVGTRPAPLAAMSDASREGAGAEVGGGPLVRRACGSQCRQPHQTQCGRCGKFTSAGSGSAQTVACFLLLQPSEPAASQLRMPPQFRRSEHTHAMGLALCLAQN